jgi:hypothetical protein
MELLHERCAALDIGKKELKACVRAPSPKGRRSRRQHPGPLRWAAVEAGKWARVRPGPRNFLDAVSSSVSMGLGATDRSCRLLR